MWNWNELFFSFKIVLIFSFCEAILHMIWDLTDLELYILEVSIIHVLLTRLLFTYRANQIWNYIFWRLVLYMYFWLVYCSHTGPLTYYPDSEPTSLCSFSCMLKCNLFFIFHYKQMSFTFLHALKLYLKINYV
jgi:hypothetical protein